DDEGRRPRLAGSLQRVERHLLLPWRREGDALDVVEQRRVADVEGPARRGRHAADRVAVIAVLERENPSAVLAAVLPKAQRHLDRDLDRGRAAVGIKDVVEAWRRQRDEPARQDLRRLMR